MVCPTQNFPSSFRYCTGTSSRLEVTDDFVISKLELLNTAWFSIGILHAFDQFLEPHGKRHRKDLMQYANILERSHTVKS